MKWFRLYSEMMHDPKVQRLPAELFRTWINLLCVASEHGGTLPSDITALAFSLRMTPSKMAQCLKALVAAGLIDDGEPMRPHNWAGRQYQSDDVATRVKRHRERKKVVTSNVTQALPETPPDTDTDSEGSDLGKEPKSALPMSDQDRLWKVGVPWLVKRSEKPVDRVKSVVGKWAKDHGAKRVLEAISLAQAREVVEPISFIVAALGDKTKGEVFELRPLGAGG